MENVLALLQAEWHGLVVLFVVEGLHADLAAEVLLLLVLSQLPELVGFLLLFHLQLPDELEVLLLLLLRLLGLDELFSSQAVDQRLVLRFNVHLCFLLVQLICYEPFDQLQRGFFSAQGLP